MRDHASQFVVRRPAIALIALADQAETLERDAGQIDRLDRDSQAMHGGGVGSEAFDDADIDADGHGAGALRARALAELDKALAIEL